MRAFIFCLLFATQAFAIDYSLCTNFLKEEKPMTFLSMDKNGNIIVDHSKVDYYKSEDPKNIVLKKTWNDKKDKSLIRSRTVSMQKKDDGTIVINQYEVGSVEQVKFVQSGYGYSNMNFMQPYSSPYRQDNLFTQHQVGTTRIAKSFKPLFSTSTAIIFKIKNKKCYPESVDTSHKFYPIAGGYGQDINIVAKSERCRKILDYFNNNPSLKTCTTADALKGLKKIIQYVPGSWRVGNKLLEELDKNLSDANKIVEMATRELTKCNNFLLTEAVQDDVLWEQTTPNNGTEKSGKAVIER